MAGADYYSCDNCGCKTFYDANCSFYMEQSNPDTGHPWPDGNIGSMTVLCIECAKLPSRASVLRQQLTAKDEEIAKLREALEYFIKRDSFVFDDDLDRARAALQEDSE